jgi:hypothetical protein
MKTKTWKDLTLRQAQELIQLADIENPGLLEIEVETLSIVLDKDPADIEDWTPKEILTEYSKYSFINKMPEERDDDIILVGNKKFKRLPFTQFSVAQMVDIEEYVNDGLIPNIHKILSRIYHPTKRNWHGKLIIDEYQQSTECEDDFQELPMDIVYGNLLFFYRIVQIYLNNTQDYLQTTMEELATTMKKELEESQSTK